LQYHYRIASRLPICVRLGTRRIFERQDEERKVAKERAQRGKPHIIIAQSRNYRESAPEIILFSRLRVRESRVVIVITVVP